jgi:hypothetical protein
MGRRLPNSGYARKNARALLLLLGMGEKKPVNVDVFPSVFCPTVYKDAGVFNRKFLPDISSFNHSA